ncbi:MAG TPA: tail fiber protein [Acidimicrobiales bacterium]|nr:tail fiber protein [Acidimicrobiales bacterium]
MSEPFIGEIRLFGFNFAPVGWAQCNGQLLAIAQNTALFSLLGTMYGGNGTTTFGLPDLRGRAPLSAGQGPGLANYDQGQVGGTESVTLTAAQVPAHGHTVAASNGAASANRPGGGVPAAGGAYAGTSDGTTMNAAMVAGGGSGQPFDNRSPYLAVNFCIALEGIFPSRS